MFPTSSRRAALVGRCGGQRVQVLLIILAQQSRSGVSLFVS